MFKLLQSIAGFGVTFSTMFKRPITEGYPERRSRPRRGFTAVTN